MFSNVTSNQDKLNFLERILSGNAAKNDKQFKLYYTLSLMRFGIKIPVLYRERAGANIAEAVRKFIGIDYNPDYIIIEVFTGRSRNVKKPIAVVKLKSPFI